MVSLDSFWFRWTRSGQTRSSSPLRRCWLPNLKHCSSTCCLHVLLPRVARGHLHFHLLRTLRVEIFAFVRLLLALLFLSWVLGSQPWLFSSWVLGSQPWQFSSWVLGSQSLAVCSWVLGSQSLDVCSWVLGSQSLAVSLSSRPFGSCFIQPSVFPSSGPVRV